MDVDVKPMSEHAARLRAYTSRLSVALVVFGFFYSGVGVVLGSVRFFGLGAVLLTYQAAIFVARARLRREDVDAAAEIVAYGTFYVCVGATAFVPVAYATLVVGCGMGVASALPYLRGRRLKTVFAVGVVSAAVVSVLGFAGADMPMPVIVRAITVICTPPWATYLLFSLLWQFNARLRATVDAERLAQERLSLLAKASQELGTSLDYSAILTTAVNGAIPALADWCVAEAVGDGGTIVTAHAGKESEPAAPDSSERSRRTVVVPLAAGGRAFGSILFGRGPGRAPFDGPEKELTREYARRAATALENGRLYTEAHAAARVRDEFLATVSHELRTPLQAILGWSALLRKRASDPTALGRGLDIIDRSVRVQGRLIDDLLDVGRILGGKLVIERRPADGDAIVRAALDAVRPMATARGVEIDITSTPGECALLADADRLQQVVWNLLTNAVKFSASGGRVQVSLRRVGERLRITVTDEGEGIDGAFLPHVFDRFRQADSSATRRHGGLGLGLSITRQLVELHGGTLRAESEGIGKGATFVVELPTSLEGQSEGPAVATKDAVRRLNGLDVLVVEDDADARELLVAILEDAGASVRAMASSREALAAVQERAPQVIVSDIAMPEEDGYVMLAKARAVAARDRAWMPAIALTAYTSPSDRALALRRGFQAHLGKPVRPEQIIDAVAAICLPCGEEDAEASDPSDPAVALRNEGSSNS